MAFICPVFKWLGCPVFKWHLNTGPIGIQPLFDLSNTKLVQYSDLHCTGPILCSDPACTVQLIESNLHGFNIVAHVEVGVAQLAVDGAQGSKVVSAGLQNQNQCYKKSLTKVAKTKVVPERMIS